MINFVCFLFGNFTGDVDNLWKIEKLRSEIMKTHTIGSGFSCAKGFLLQHKPEEAAKIIQVVTQVLNNKYYIIAWSMGNNVILHFVIC